MTKKLSILLLAAGAVLLFSCADPRTPAALAPELSHTETIVLWEQAVSNNATISADFTVRAPLADINQPGLDEPARLTVAAYIVPDADVYWYESIVGDSIPAWTNAFIRYLVAIERYQGVLDSVAGVRALCDTVPASCPPDTSGLIPAEQSAGLALAPYQDSLAVGVADTTRLGATRDSLGIVLDNRFVLALWMDGDTTTVYPDALLDGAGRLSGQGFYLAATNSETNMKGRGFELDMAQFEAADLRNPGRPIEFNWTTCFIGSTRPCLSEGTHTLHARATGVSRITAAVVLVYAEERP